MAGIQDYDNLVLGSGEAGKYIAWTLARKGQRTAVVERNLIGGSCPNIACLPSKNTIHTAKVASLCGRAAEFGITTGSPATNMKAVRERKRRMVDGLARTHLTRYKESGAELIMGEGRFVEEKTIEVAAEEWQYLRRSWPANIPEYWHASKRSRCAGARRSQTADLH